MRLTISHKKINFRDVIVIDLHFPDGSTIHYERPPIDWFPLLMALFVAVCAFLKRFLTANHRRSQNLRAGPTDAGDKARQYAETEELIRSIIDDMTKE